MLVLACGGDDEPTVADESGEIRIELDEFSFSPSKIQLTPGEQVTLVLVNVGEKDHEFMSGNDVMMMEGVPAGFMMDFLEPLEPLVMMQGGMEMDDEAMEEMGHVRFGVQVLAGTTVRITSPCQLTPRRIRIRLLRG